MIVKLCAYLLVKLGLVGAVIFFVGAIIICLANGIKIEGDVFNFILVGTVIVAIGSIIAVGYFKDKKKKKEREKNNKQNPKSSSQSKEWKRSENAPKENFDSNGYVNSGYASGSQYNDLLPHQSQRQNVAYKDNVVADGINSAGFYGVSGTARKGVERDDASVKRSLANERLHETPEQMQRRLASEQEHFESEERYRKKYLSQPYVKVGYNAVKSEKREQSQDVLLTPQEQMAQEKERLQSVIENEQPLVFATRKDPNIIILEYSDRLMFYKKTENGPLLISTEYKSNSKNLF